MTALERRHRTLAGAALAQGSRQETRGRRMIILTASGRGWRIESVRTLGYGEQGGRQVRMEGVLLRNSGRNSGVRALGTDSGRTGSVRTLELNSGRIGCTGRTGRSEDAVRAHQMYVFFLRMHSHLHKVPEGLSSYILPTGSSRTDRRDVYGVITCVPLILVFGVGTQLPRRPLMTCHSNTGAGGGCYLFPSKFVSVKVG